MGKYDAVRERTGWGIPGAQDTSRRAAEVSELIKGVRKQVNRVRGE